MESSAEPKTLSLPALEAYLKELGLPIPIPAFPSTSPIHNPIDIYRSYIAAALEKLVDCDGNLLYDSLQWTSKPSQGDITLVLPRLRIKGVKLEDLGVELAAKVRRPPFFPYTAYSLRVCLTRVY
jgi:arginyl-tRNA synthetase